MLIVPVNSPPSSKVPVAGKVRTAGARVGFSARTGIAPAKTSTITSTLTLQRTAFMGSTSMRRSWQPGIGLTWPAALQWDGQGQPRTGRQNTYPVQLG